MSAGEGHVIGTALFELSCEGVASPFPGERELADLVRTHLLPRAEEIFDRLADPDTVVRIDRLVLDLGTISAGNAAMELESRFVDHLRTALSHSPTDIERLSGVDVPVRVESGEEERAELGYFLRRGRLPWHVPGRRAEDLDAVARRAIQADGTAFAAFLGEVARDEGAIRRFIRQMSDATVREAVRLVAAGEHARWTSILDAVRDTAARELGQADREALRTAVATHVFAGLLRPGSTGGVAELLNELGPKLPSTQRQALETALRTSVSGTVPPLPATESEGRSSTAERHEGPDTLAKLEAALRHADGPALRTLLDVAVLQDRHGSRRTIVRLLADPTVRRRLAETLALAELLDLVAAVDPRAVGTVGEILVHAADGRPHPTEDSAGDTLPSATRLLLDLLAAAGDRPTDLDRLARAAGPHSTEEPVAPAAEEGGTPEETTRERPSSTSDLPAVIDAVLGGDDLAPFAATVRRWVSEHPELLAQALRRHARASGTRRRMARTLSLATLLDMVRLLRPEATGDVADVLARPPATIARQIPGDSDRMRETLWDLTLAHLVLDGVEPFNRDAYLRSMDDRIAARGISAHQAPRPDQTGLSRGYELREMVAAHLGDPASDTPVRESEALSHLAEMREYHPQHLLWLVWETHGPGVETLQERVPRGSAALLRAVVEAFLRAVGSGTGATDDLSHVVATLAQEATEPASLYHDVLRRLVGGGLVDIDELRNAHRTPGEPGIAPSEPIGEPADEAAPPTGVSFEDALSAAVAGDASAGGELRALIADALARNPDGLRLELEAALESTARARALVDALPASLLARIVLLCRPGLSAELLHAADAIATAVMFVAEMPASGMHALQWRFVLRYLFGEERLPRPDLFARAFFDHLVETARPRGSTAFADEVRARLAADLHAGGQAHRWVLEAISAPPSIPESEGRPEYRPVTWEMDGAVLIANAGLVLVAPFLPRLFGVLGLTEGPEFRDAASAERATHLLQYLVEGRADRPEHTLVLNKILCGLDGANTLPRAIHPTPEEEETIQDLLASVIRTWKIVGNTSVEGLRESFLQRDGTLTVMEEGWRLRVEERAFDMLIDRIPWSFGVIRMPWMKGVLHVEWR